MSCTLQPFAWESREFLRKKLIGKEVSFTVEYKAPGTGREYGCIYLGKGELTWSVCPVFFLEFDISYFVNLIKKTKCKYSVKRI